MSLALCKLVSGIHVFYWSGQVYYLIENWSLPFLFLSLRIRSISYSSCSSANKIGGLFPDIFRIYGAHMVSGGLHEKLCVYPWISLPLISLALL